MPYFVQWNGIDLRKLSGTAQTIVASKANIKFTETNICFFIKKNSLIPTAANKTVSQSIQSPPAMTIGINKIKAITAVITRCFIYLPNYPIHRLYRNVDDDFENQ